MAGKDTANFAERLAQVEGAIGDAAEANVNPLTQMNNALGDLAETMGESLLPIIEPLIEDITEMAEKLQTLNPQVFRWAALLLSELAAIGLIAGPLALIGKVVIPAVTFAIGALGLAIGALGGPLIVGAVVVALGGMFFAWKSNFLGMQKVTAAFMECHRNNFLPFLRWLGDHLVEAFSFYGLDLSWMKDHQQDLHLHTWAHLY